MEEIMPRRQRASSAGFIQTEEATAAAKAQDILIRITLSEETPAAESGQKAQYCAEAFLLSNRG